MVKWSIIIPAYNEEKYLAKTLYSCERAIEGSDAEIIVVANGCTDGTVRVAKKSKAKVIEIVERGISLAKNVGASKANGDVLVFLDADTLLAKDALKTIGRNLKRCDFGSLWMLPYPSTFKSRLLMGIKNHYFLFSFYKGTNGIIFTKRNIYDAVGGFNENLKKREDKEFIYSAVAHGKYRFITESFVKTSMRRFQHKGYAWVVWYWIRTWATEKIGKNNTDYPVFR